MNQHTQKTPEQSKKEIRKNSSPLTREEVVSLCAKAQTGDKKSLQIMIASNIGLAIMIAKRYVKKYPSLTQSMLELSDLINMGVVGLIKAIKTFNPDKNTHFSTHAMWWIRDAISSDLMAQSNTIRVPVHLLREMRQVAKARKHLEKSGATVSYEEIDAYLQTQSDDKKEMAGTARRSYALEHMCDNLSFDELLKDHSSEMELMHWQESSTENYFIDTVRLRTIILSKLLVTLDEESQDILRRKFGLYHHHEHSYAEIGKIYDLTGGAIQYKMVCIITKLRQKAEELGYRYDDLF